MLRDLNISLNGRRDSTDPRVGVLASEVPTGFALPAFLLNDIDQDFPNRLYSVEILTLPGSGTLYLDKTGAGTFSGAADGTYTGSQRVQKFDPGVGRVSSVEGTYSMMVGLPVVTSVTVTPNTATGSAKFTATVNGTNSPSQDVTWAASAGTIDNTGQFVAPEPSEVTQTITITATSVADPTKSGTATVTIAAIVVPMTVAVSLRSRSTGTLPNLTSLKWAWFDQPNPSLFEAPTDKGSTANTDANGQLLITLQNTALDVGGVGWLIVTDSDGNPESIHKAFSGPVEVS